ncbi:DNA translocase FtsK [Modicisalibacter muralis]|uniref:DNA translocase FtsK n=1 Tax=Modicisalibacter muralis TaxID=119000 RepID=A0A1G9F1J4_9GAMM|nr:DNA translocase FtsK 4TM domain-containing protein [Halomonas muralis]SDK82208.1 DNA translocase FtsK [Halomonas muralis]
MSVKKKTDGRRRTTTTQAKEQARRFGLRLQGVSREGVIIVLLAACVFLLLAMFSYSPQDPGWSHSGPGQDVDNWMGPIGAWLSDVLYSLFGASALWWPGMLGFAAWRLMRRREVRLEWDATALAVRAGGLVLLLLATTSLGALHFFNPQSELPYSAGGILGEGLAEALVPLVGLRGATLLSIASFLCAFPLFSGLSWLTVMDELGSLAHRLLRWVGRQFGGARTQLANRREARVDAIAEQPTPEREDAGVQASDRPSWWRRWFGRDKGPQLDRWDAEPALAGGRREPQLHEFDDPDSAPGTGMALRAERDAGIAIPWDVPERTPSAKRPEAAYTAQEARIKAAFGASRSEPATAHGAQQSPTASKEVALRADVTRRRMPEPGEPASKQATHGPAEPILPDDDEPIIPPSVSRPPAGDSSPAPTRHEPAREEPRDESADSRQDHAASASSASSPHSVARQGPPAINWDEWDDSDDEADANEPRLSWSDATAERRDDAPEDDDIPLSAVEAGASATPDELDDDDVPCMASADQARAAADDPEGPTLWTVEHLQSQRPVMDNLPEPGGELPSLRLLTPPDPAKPNYSPQQLVDMAELLEMRLQEYGVKAEVVETWPGPVITRFEIKPAAGVKVSKISNLAKDLARSLMVKSVRVVEVIPGRPTVGIEIPNPNRAMIRLREVIDSDAYQQAASPLTLALGHDIGGGPVVANLGKMPHLLVAGTTGSGKSVGVNGMLISMLLKATPDDVRMIMVDPKMLELSVYDGIPHLLAPVVTDMKEAANGLRWCVAEMERRYKLMAAMGVRNIAGFNAKLDEAERAGAQVADPLWEPQPWQMHEQPPVLEKLPYIVVVIDEFADMFMIVGKKVEELIARLAQKARAAGIHLILATQRPSVDVVTGLIKANIPTRMAFQVSSKVDSRTILDQGGAEALLGHGDMLYLPAGSGMPTRVHGAFVDDDEVHRVVEDWKRRGEPEYIDEILTGGVSAEALTGLEADGSEGGDAEQDALYDEAVMFVTETRRASISAVQRRFKIGYNRAARLVEAMEAAGVVSSMGTNGSREVLAPPPVGG